MLPCIRSVTRPTSFAKCSCATFPNEKWCQTQQSAVRCSLMQWERRPLYLCCCSADSAKCKKNVFVFACCGLFVCNFESLVASRALARVRRIVWLQPLLIMYAADTCVAAAVAGSCCWYRVAYIDIRTGMIMIPDQDIMPVRLFVEFVFFIFFVSCSKYTVILYSYSYSRILKKKNWLPRSRRILSAFSWDLYSSKIVYIQKSSWNVYVFLVDCCSVPVQYVSSSR